MLRVVGVGWLVSLPYWFIAAAGFHVLTLIHRRRPIFPGWVGQQPLRAGRAACFASFVAVISIFAYGYHQYVNPVTTHASITLKKPGGAAGSVRIAVVSDLHLGDIAGKARLAQNVAQINAIQADMIVLVGDIIDREPDILWEQNLQEEFLQLKAPLGIYAVLGNHEHIVGRGDSCASFLERYCGVRVLRDELVPVADGRFYLAGRRDRNEGRARRALADIVRGANSSLPIIVLDHQPVNLSLREAAAAGAALQISGHTHGGQVWPVNWVTPLLYKVDYGLGWEGDMGILVTSGLGLWGVPVRIGTVSEVVDLQVHFDSPRGGTP
ncbi:MAG: metallophosphoesterase [Puniceicoccales bacterium]|nr:metallophosphoesterase [Puniceicoccales bacterium]